VDAHALLAKSATLSAPVVFHYTSDATRLQHMADRLWGALQVGAARVHIGAQYPLSAASEAHRALESRGTRGSTILLP
jgi:NADPH:quinone reductase